MDGYDEVKDLVIKGQIHCDPTDVQHEALHETSKSQRQQSRLEQQPVVDLNTGLGFVKESELNKHFLCLYSSLHHHVCRCHGSAPRHFQEYPDTFSSLNPLLMTTRLIVSWAAVSFCNLESSQLEASVNFSLLGEIFPTRKSCRVATGDSHHHA